uniref:Amidohydro-rel domain-containing protein n=1 Tax=Caenorhabditis japonica TaxID=281687 RepID=A0A8R1I0B8_CAEJA
MINAGITTVGEFHYVHHSEQRFDLDQFVIQAAIDAGIRIVLLQTLYERAGFDKPPVHPVQERFISGYEDFIENLESFRKEQNHPRVQVGVAAHSARAVPFENIKKLFDYATEQKIPFHIHLEEQPKEILDCQKWAGQKQGPSDILLSDLSINEYFTAVHATFTPQSNMVQFAKLGANVSICPCTEGYLGDGIPRINDSLKISFGTDCNNRICFLEEMRWACFSQQMLNNSRSVCGLSPEKLLQCATIDGARSLSLTSTTGSFEIGKYFDAVSFSLDSPLLAHSLADTLVDSLVLSAGNREISHVFVSGVDRKT